MEKNKKLGISRLVVSLMVLFAITALSVYSLPTGPTITHISNETVAGAGQGTQRSDDDGGYIITLRLNTSQQNYAWKAYVGNVTGVLSLADSDNNPIYEWSVPTINQEVYISRNQNVNWSSINCSNESVKVAEDTALGLTSSSSNSINRTFSQKGHKAFIVAGASITQDQCFSIATFNQSGSQVLSATSEFQEVLLADNNANLIYTALVNQDTAGFDGETYDFQAIVADEETAGVKTTYYFYVELA